MKKCWLIDIHPVCRLLLWWCSREGSMLGPLRPWGTSLLRSYITDMMEANLVMVLAQTCSEYPVESLSKGNPPCQSSWHSPYPQKVLSKLLPNGWMNKLVYEWMCVWINSFPLGRLSQNEQSYSARSSLLFRGRSPNTHWVPFPQVWASLCITSVHFLNNHLNQDGICLHCMGLEANMMRCLIQELYCWFGRVQVQLSAFSA